MSLFPIFLKLTARPCIVIGAGNLAESKIESLRAAEAQVTVIAPNASPAIQELAASGEITWHARTYADGDIVPGTFLVVTATDVPAVNRAVYLEATSKAILCNAVDDPPYCDFYFPSVVKRGDLQNQIIAQGKPLLSRTSYWATLHPGTAGYRVFSKQMANVPPACGFGTARPRKTAHAPR